MLGSRACGGYDGEGLQPPSKQLASIALATSQSAARAHASRRVSVHHWLDLLHAAAGTRRRNWGVVPAR